jgi:sodium/bile acid cotransporter 7
MMTFLVRRWFLLLLAAGLAAAWFCPQALRWTRGLQPRFVVGLALFLMAWGLPTRNLLRVLAHPWPALWAVLISYGALPALGWCAGWLLPDDFRVGLLIVTSVPCTLASAALWTRLAGGDEALALLVTLLTTATSWLFTSAWLALATGAAVALDLPALMGDLFVILVLPVGLGQGARGVGVLARTAQRHQVGLGVLSRLLIFAIILKAAVDVGDRLREPARVLTLDALLLTAVLCVATHLAALASGFWSSKVLRFDRPSQIAVAFAGSQKTLPVGLFLFEAYFQAAYPLAVVPLVFYHISQLVADTFIADRLAPRRPTSLPPSPPNTGARGRG